MNQILDDSRTVIIVTENGYIRTNVKSNYNETLVHQRRLSDLIPLCLDSFQNDFNFERIELYNMDENGILRYSHKCPTLDKGDILFAFEPSFYYDTIYTGDTESKKKFRDKQNTQYSISFNLDNKYVIYGHTWNFEEIAKSLSEQFITVHEARIIRTVKDQNLENVIKSFNQYLKPSKNIFSINPLKINRFKIHSKKLFMPDDYPEDFSIIYQEDDGSWVIGDDEE